MFRKYFHFLLILLQLFACSSPGSDSSQLRRIPADERILSYFKDTYEESRRDFREIGKELQRMYSGSKCGYERVPSRTENDLTIDWCFFPPTQKRGDLLILVSGIHGGEGYTGSAVQRHFMREILPRRDRSTSGYLLIHGLNPYGFKTFRRTTENNVDLNRNFDYTGDRSLYEIKNPGYAELDDFLNPKKPASTLSFGYVFFTPRAINKILWNGLPVLRQAILQGQYEFEKGIYFGGRASEPHREILIPIFRESSKGFRSILAVDLHTGYGERGVLHLFPNEPKTEEIRLATERMFQGFRIDWGSSDDFYTINGQFTDWILTTLPSGSLYVPMVFEYGTLDSQTTSGSIESIKRTMLENQGHFYGYTCEREKVKIRNLYREMFYPSSPHWRTKVVLNTVRVWEEVLPRLKNSGL